LTLTKKDKEEIEKIIEKNQHAFEAHVKSIRHVSIRTAIFSGILVGLIFVILIWDISDDNKPSIWLIAFVGIIAFFGMLMISSYHSEHHPKHIKGSKGVLRRAITSSFVCVYFIVLSLILFGEQSLVEDVSRDKILGHFTNIIIVIVGFYFGSKGAIELYKEIHSRTTDQSTEDQSTKNASKKNEDNKTEDNSK